MTRLDLAQDSNKQRIVDTFVNSIYVHEDKAVINMNCCDEEEIIPFDVESGSFLSRFRELKMPENTKKSRKGCVKGDWRKEKLRKRTGTPPCIETEAQPRACNDHAKKRPARCVDTIISPDTFHLTVVAQSIL